MVITGGSSGIGEGLAKIFSELEASVIITGWNEEELERVVRECNGDVQSVVMDFSDPYTVDK